MAVFKNSSTLLTTGYNGFGQLGNGNLTTESTLSTVLGLPNGHANMVSMGADHTLALSFSNMSSVYACGSNYHGQLGNATIGGAAIATSGTGAYSDTFVKLTFPGRVTAISAGGFHSLAIVGGTGTPPAPGLPYILTTPGTVYAWGYNGFGQLGDGTENLTDSSLPLPVPLPGQGAYLMATQVAAGGGHSLALDSSGFVWAWGDNTYGQLGTNPTTGLPDCLYSPHAQQVEITSATPLTPLANIMQIAAGGSTSYALEYPVTTNGVTTQKIWAWGFNGMGQLGYDPTLPATPYSLPQVNNNQSVDVNSYTPVLVPVPIVSVLVNSIQTPVTIVKIAAGADHVLALMSDGSVMAWGFNNLGQVGNNNNTVTLTNNLITSAGDHTRIFTPVHVLFNGTAVVGSGAPMSNVTDIMAFGNSSMALMNGKWYGWGDNSFGQLGNPVSNTSIAYLLLPTPIQGF
jgi:alpha-tubulin suppressor-like RCC1 family protein